MPPALCRSACGVVCAVGLWGQSLHVPASETRRKTPGSFTLMLESPAGKSPTAVQWEFSIPPAIEVRTTDITAGSAAESAKKSLTCAAKVVSGGGTRFMCILAGEKASIGNGPVAVVLYRPKGDVHGAPVRVGIEHVVGVSADLKEISLPDTSAILTIR
jgi:hypothetical protein